MTPGGLLAALFLLLALYCGIDPLNHSSIANFPEFEAHLVQMPPWSEVPAAKDDRNLLQKAEIKFLNQVQGPESVAFEPLGRGPYTGVADGRILFWNGEAWSDFAYTSPNRSTFEPLPRFIHIVIYSLTLYHKIDLKQNSILTALNTFARSGVV